MSPIKRMAMSALMFLSMLGSVLAADPVAPGFEEFKEQVLMGAEKHGAARDSCTVTQDGAANPDGTFFATVSCNALPNTCVFIVDAAAKRAAPLVCAPNPKYIKPDSTPKQSI